MTTTKCDYQITGTKDGIIFIEDLNWGRMSVTNDAENVLHEVRFTYGIDARVVYRDSEGEWSEIVTTKTWMGEGVGFLPWHGLDWDILQRK